MKLFEKDSVEDLLLRGYGDVQIRKMTGVSMRLHKAEYLEKLNGINITEYCGKHVDDRFSRITVIGILDDYSTNKISVRDVKAFFGILWKTEKECELTIVMQVAGYGDKYKECVRLRQKAIQSKIEQTNILRYGGKTPMSDISIREKVKATMVETYGVENISQLDSIKEKKKQTTLKNHGVEHSFQSSEIRAKAKETIRKKYGVDNVSQADEIKKKKAKTTFSHFGVENSLQSKEVQDKIAESLRRNHGITDESITHPFQIKEVRDKAKETHLQRYGVENPFELDNVQEQIKQHWREEYGVDNSSQVLEIQKKRVETMLERFGVENPFANEDVKEKIRLTNLEKYGVEYASQSDEVKERVRQTNLERYGVEYTLQADIIREHIRQTNLEKYGVECVLQSDEIREQIRQTNLERYGVENPAQSDIIKDRMRQTNLDRYGVEHAIQSDEVQEKIRQTNLERYGVEYISQSDEIQDKIRQTNLERYGVTSPMQCPEIKQKVKNTNIERYGTECPLQNADIMEKTRQTNLERYGVEYISQSEMFKDKVKMQNLQKYGVENVMQCPEIKQKVSDTKRENGTFNTSAPEQWLFEMFTSIFGEHDVFTQYNKDQRYPFHCDFYIKSRDMFIELNAFWTHGNGWFDENSIVDNIKLSEWIQGCKTKDSEFYKGAIQNWTINDVAKRKHASDHNLNYIVFWDSQLDDARLWLAIGCPDGQDWREEYSWLPKRQISFSRRLPEVLSSAKWITAAAKSANGNLFYQNEIKAWDENLSTKRGKLHGCLYANRFKYLGKLPNELSDVEILRGLSISRLVKDNYSSFDVTTMLDVFSKYNVKSIYDPCAGWGERLLACGINNISYIGCDINPDLHVGYNKLIQHYELQNVSVICDDSSNYDATNNAHDTVFTCPPYGNREIYTEVGAENLSDDEFLLWWNSVVKHSISPTTKYFMYQIDKKHRDDMNQILQKNGLVFIEEIVASDSTRHENKAKGKRIRENYEAIQVFAIPQK